jgi:hypothetical protein
VSSRMRQGKLACSAYRFFRKNRTCLPRFAHLHSTYCCEARQKGGETARCRGVTTVVVLRCLASSGDNNANTMDDYCSCGGSAGAARCAELPPIDAGAGPFTLTLAYKTAARNLAEKRIALAGARLAKILNDEVTRTHA